MIIPTHVYFLRLSTYTSVFNTDVSLAIGQVYNINMTKPIQMKISITLDTRPLPKKAIVLCPGFGILAMFPVKKKGKGLFLANEKRAK